VPPDPGPLTVAVVLNYRTPDLTARAVESLQVTAPSSPVIVVDNGSDDGSVETLRRLCPGGRLLAAEQNAGFSAGCNLGITAALALGADRVLLLNSDAVAIPEMLTRLSRALDANPKVGIVGPSIVSLSEPDSVQSRGIAYSRVTGRMRHYAAGSRRTEAADAHIDIVDGVSGCAMLIRRHVLERVGVFTEDYFFGFEDLELCLRARAAGFMTACVPAAIVLHAGSASIGAASPRLIYFSTRNHLLMASRCAASVPRSMRWLQTASILGFNLAHALITSPVGWRAGLRAYLRGAGDYFSGRFDADYARGRASGSHDAVTAATPSSH
jgi:GT2 family glycosyltransferase